MAKKTSRTVRIRRLTLIAVVLALLSISVPASAQQSVIDPEELVAQGLLRLDDIEAGVLLFETDQPGWYVPAPALHTDIDVAVSGPLARVTVTQRFRNLAQVFVEGKYVFPLPEGSAVDTLRMRVGNRWIEGTIEEREEARLIYEEAKASGQVASLVEQERPNVFTTSVANIGPDATVIVQIEYQQTLAPTDGQFGLRLPLVVAPRYSPVDPGSYQVGVRPATHELGPDGWQSVVAPIRDPRADAPGTIPNPVEISVDLNAGFPLGDVRSLYHQVDVDRVVENAADVQVMGPVPADRDFYLSWTPRELTDPSATIFAEQRQGETHYVALLTPPAATAVGDVQQQPREVIFVQDTSGSMEGESMEQAKAGLVMALERLNENDVFNLVEFDSFFTTFEDEPVPATAANVRRAVRFVEGLVADEGTEMYSALEEAFIDTTPNDGRLRQVIFLTDGAVSNEAQLLGLIEDRLGSSRLFTVGIGSAPNSYFMTAAATAGRGTSVFIGDLGEVNEQMQALFVKIESAAVVDLTIEDLPANVTVSPFPIPDLYVGDPIALTVRVPGTVDLNTLTLTGQRGAQDWQADLVLADAETRPGVSKLWAREHIRHLESLRVSSVVSVEQREELDASILETALDFGLVSRLTSLVAVDLEVTRPADANAATAEVPTNLPAGWDVDSFLGDAEPGDYTLSAPALERLNGAEQIRAADVDPATGLPFAATGGDWQLQALIGAAVAGFGALGLRISNRRRST